MQGVTSGRVCDGLKGDGCVMRGRGCDGRV